MGLDMWLCKTAKPKTTKAFVQEFTPEGNELEEIKYWRKSNAIHNWFVQNVQDGVDKCIPHKVNIEQIKKLLETIKAVLKDRDRADELLPTQEGFFFGGTDYDEWYWGDLEETRDVLEKAVKDHEDGDEYEYHSSW